MSIYTSRSREEAHLAVAKLRDYGIAARTDGEEMALAGLGAFSGPGSVSPLNAKVQVLESDAVAAKAMLEDVDRRRVARLTSLPCPTCGAIKPDRIWPKRRLAAIAGVALGFALLCTGVATWPAALLACASVTGILWPLTPVWRCTACRHVWRAPDPDSLVEDDEEEGGDDEEPEEDVPRQGDRDG